MDYNDIPGINQSALKHILTSPLAYRWWLDHERASSPSLTRGDAVHVAVLEPDRFAREYVRAEHSGATKAGKEERVSAAESGLTLLTATDYDLAVACRDAVRAHPVARRYLGAIAETEVALQWSLDGRACKGRLDAVGHHGLLLELKSTRALARFAADCAAYHYPLQLAWYHDGLEQSRTRPSEVIMIAVETAPPHDVACYVVPDSVLELGRAEYERALRILSECEGRDTWPGAHPDEEVLVLPGWAYRESHPDEEVLTDE
jgi:hypothetical protein